MEPLRELLNRIRWDRSFGAGTFELGVYDRVEDQVLRVPLAHVRFEPGNSFSLFLEDSDGQTVTVPLHRVREVYKDGTLIWKREGREGGHPGG
jgi:uncharacterized protein (UPF0248 family)